MPRSPRLTDLGLPKLSGKLYGEPLVDGSQVLVATEADTVDSLSATTGKPLWKKTLADPGARQRSPLHGHPPNVGITSTPVIDPARNEIFVVADQLVSGVAQHHLHGLDLTTGASDLDMVVDAPGSDPLAQLQRVALNLDAGRVIVGYGGNAGDCSDYHGWLVSAPEAGGDARRPLRWTPGGSRARARSGWAAAVRWSTPTATSGCPPATGRSPRRPAPYDDSDSVLELSPSLSLLQYFAPSTWARTTPPTRTSGRRRRR